MSRRSPFEVPMFPLGSVLLPGMALPLHVFEPRYRSLVEVVLATDPPDFASVLIERGSEVGGGDVRSSVGCSARVVRAEELPDGRWALVALGVRRLRVLEWLPDDPFPRAVVEHWDDPVVDHATAGPRLDELELAVRGVVALAHELGAAGPPEDLVFSEDDALRLYQLATVTPIGAHDRLQVLSCGDPVERATLLEHLVADQEVLLRARGSFDP